MLKTKRGNTMYVLKLNKRGFGIPGLILLIIALSLVTIVGYRIYSQTSKTNLTSTPDMAELLSKIQEIDDYKNSSSFPDSIRAVFRSESGRLVDIYAQSQGGLSIGTSSQIRAEDIGNNKKELLKIFSDYMESFGLEYYSGIEGPEEDFNATMYKRGDLYCYIDRLTGDSTIGCMYVTGDDIDNKAQDNEYWHLLADRALGPNTNLLLSVHPEEARGVEEYEVLGVGAYNYKEHKGYYYFEEFSPPSSFYSEKSGRPSWTVGPNLYLGETDCSEFDLSKEQIMYAEYACIDNRKSGSPTQESRSTSVSEYWN
jgi:hypothetical protein